MAGNYGKKHSRASEAHSVACITDAIATQHQARGVLILALEDEQHGIFIARDDIKALIADLQWFLETHCQKHARAA